MIQECVVATDLAVLRNINLIAIGLAACACMAIKHYRGLLYALVLFSFYCFAASLHCDFKAIDPDKVWRYVIWSAIDMVFLSVLWVLSKKHLIDIEALVASCAIEAIAIFSHVIRMADYRVTSYALSDYFYSEMIWFTNFGFVCLAWLPVYRHMLIRQEW